MFNYVVNCTKYNLQLCAILLFFVKYSYNTVKTRKIKCHYAMIQRANSITVPLGCVPFGTRVPVLV